MEDSLQHAPAMTRPWIVISAWEVLAAHVVGVLVWARQIFRLVEAPGVEEQWEWLPAICRPWLYLMYFTVLVTPCTCALPLLIWCLLAKETRDRQPTSWLARGSPRFVGAILSVAIAYLFFAGFVLLAQLED